MTSMVKYDAARRALAEAVAVDEVQDLRNKADAMRVYAMQAKNKDMEVDAAEIRIRAERRLGELIAAQKQFDGLNRGRAGRAPIAVDGDDRDTRPKLSDVGVSKDLSSRAQKLAAVPEEEFESEVGEWRERVKAEGERVTTRLASAGDRAIKEQADAYTPETYAQDQADDAITILSQENDELRARLAIGLMDGTEEEKQEAADTIDDLRQQVRTLTAENSALKASRDHYQAEASQLRKQIKMNAAELKRARAAA